MKVHRKLKGQLARQLSVGGWVYLGVGSLKGGSCDLSCSCYSTCFDMLLLRLFYLYCPCLLFLLFCMFVSC